MLVCHTPQEYAHQADGYFNKNGFFEKELAHTVETYGADSRRTSARMGRTTPRTMQSPSRVASIAFSCSTMASGGTSSRSTGTICLDPGDSASSKIPALMMRTCWALALSSLVALVPCRAQDATPPAAAADVQSQDAIMHAIYDVISPAGPVRLATGIDSCRIVRTGSETDPVAPSRRGTVRRPSRS